MNKCLLDVICQSGGVYLQMSVRASVAMCTYNGERFLKEQIDSILTCMGKDDELVISDDGSTDHTMDIVKEYAEKDNRIIIFINKEHGVVHNFNNCISCCRGKYIFLCDQDDVWLENKINKMVVVFKNKKADLVIHDGYHTDSTLRIISDTLFQSSHVSRNPFVNFISGTYWGCCMAFLSDMKKYIIPLPRGISHDLWIGVLIGSIGKVELLNEILIHHRIHDNNVTRHTTSLFFKLHDRLVFAYALCNRLLALKIRRVI